MRFNAKTGKREMTTGGCDIIRALHEIEVGNKLGCITLMISQSDYEKLSYFKIETNRRSRITHAEILEILNAKEAL